MAKFKAGDIVKLKSGGTNMTVERVEQQKSSAFKNATPTGVILVTCTWFEENKLKKHTFTEGQLEAV